MDAVKFLEEEKRMFDSIRDTDMIKVKHKTNCSGINCSVCKRVINFDKCYEGASPEEKVGIVEKWSKEHPLMTNAMKYKEVFGYEPKDEDGEYKCPPKEFNTNCIGKKCSDCKKWWNEEWKAPEGKCNE